MARYTGKDLDVRWVHSGGTAVLNADFRSFETNESVDNAEATAGDDVHRSFIPTLKDTTATLEMLDTSGTAGTVQWATLAPGTEGTVYWSPEGTASSKPKHYAAAFIEKRDRTMPYDDVVEISADFHIQAVPTESSWSA
jgi:hypothetical protein